MSRPKANDAVAKPGQRRSRWEIGTVVLAVLGVVWLRFRAQAGASAGSQRTLPNLVRAAAALFSTVTSQLPEEFRGPIVATFALTLPMSIIGALGGVGWKLYGVLQARLMHLVEKNCKVSMSFSNVDKHYDVVVDYIGSRCSVETGKILASTKPRSRPSFQEMLAGWLGGKTKAPMLYYQPDIHQHFSNSFIWTDEEGKPHRIWLQRWVEKPQFRSDSNKHQDPETLILTQWWTTDPTPLKNFMAAALKTMLREESEGRVDIYVKHMWLPMWTKAIAKDRRDRDTVILDENLADYVVDDVRHFLTKKTADWYHNAGIPYRRGYLLYGPPGCGKTSFAQVLAGELGLEVCLMNLSNQDMNDDDLAELLRAAPPRSMLLLEDVDSIFVERTATDQKKGRGGGGISFSGLLNALDGAAAQEGCVIMLTTNHKDRLDEALIRPGRCDLHVHIQKASQDQARRMFCRFFSKEAKVAATSADGVITTTAAHDFGAGEPVMFKDSGSSDRLRLNGLIGQEKAVYYVNLLSSSGPRSTERRFRLYSSAAAAQQGGSQGLLIPSGGKEAKFQSIPPSAARFSSRIPDKQVSMAKLQGYLMKQKLEAEQHFKVLRDKRELPASLADTDDMPEDEARLRFAEEVDRFASEAAVMNVHELLDVKVEAEEVDLSMYDHLRRVGLQRFAPLFEHFGIRSKKDVLPELKDRMEAWDPELKNGPLRDRLVALLNGDKALDKPYSLADLSVLRDKFISAFQADAEMPNPPSSLRPTGGALTSPGSPTRSDRGTLDETGNPPRIALLRQSSGTSEETKLNLLDLAHKFQEALEENGKTEVSLWQLDMHFQRFKGDPRGALDNCLGLRRKESMRAAAEREPQWMSTFTFLHRIGLGEHAFKLEDKGFKLWAEWKHMSKDDIKEKGDMSDQDATFCHAVVSGNKDRPDLLRCFQMPEFADLMDFFGRRFPEAKPDLARQFSLALTDESGVTHVSCLQVDRYLKAAKTAEEALGDLSKGLPLSSVAEKARERPPPPAPPKEPEDWVHGWLKEDGLEYHSRAFLNQALKTREDICDAPLDHAALEGIGVKKLGERCKLLRMIEKLQATDSIPENTSVAEDKTKESPEDKVATAQVG